MTAPHVRGVGVRALVGMLAATLLGATSVSAASGAAGTLKKHSVREGAPARVAAIAAACTTAAPLTCGAAVDSSTVGGVAMVPGYGCISYDESGPEVFYRITLDSDAEITLTLSGMSEDLDLFLLASCDPNDCLAFSATVGTEVLTRCLPAGTYYVAVDGWNGASSAFRLELACAPCTPCTPQVTHDGCPGAIVIPNHLPSWSTASSTCCATDQIHFTGCTGFSTFGNDVVYRLDMAPGCTVTVTVQDGPDGAPTDWSLYLLTDCADPAGSCVAGVDAQTQGGETLMFTSTTGGIYWLGVDAFGNGSCGDFMLDVQFDNCGTVPVESLHWQQLKQMYR